MSDREHRLCDVCGRKLEAQEKHYPLESGRYCCGDCWIEVRGGAGNPKNTRAEAPISIQISQPRPDQRAKEGVPWSGAAIAAFVLAILCLPIPLPPELRTDQMMCLNFALTGLVILLALIGINATAGAKRRGRGLAIAAIVMQGIWVVIVLSRPGA